MARDLPHHMLLDGLQSTIVVEKSARSCALQHACQSANNSCSLRVFPRFVVSILSWQELVGIQDLVWIQQGLELAHEIHCLLRLGVSAAQAAYVQHTYDSLTVRMFQVQASHIIVLWSQAARFYMCLLHVRLLS